MSLKTYSLFFFLSFSKPKVTSLIGSLLRWGQLPPELNAIGIRVEWRTFIVLLFQVVQSQPSPDYMDSAIISDEVGPDPRKLKIIQRRLLARIPWYFGAGSLAGFGARHPVIMLVPSPPPVSNFRRPFSGPFFPFPLYPSLSHSFWSLDGSCFCFCNDETPFAPLWHTPTTKRNKKKTYHLTGFDFDSILWPSKVLPRNVEPGTWIKACSCVYNVYTYSIGRRNLDSITARRIICPGPVIWAPTRETHLWTDHETRYHEIPRLVKRLLFSIFAPRYFSCDLLLPAGTANFNTTAD